MNLLCPSFLLDGNLDIDKTWFVQLWFYSQLFILIIHSLGLFFIELLEIFKHIAPDSIFFLFVKKSEKTSKYYLLRKFFFGFLADPAPDKLKLF